MPILIDIFTTILLLCGIALIFIDIRERKLQIAGGILSLAMIVISAGVMLSGHQMGSQVHEAEILLQKEQEWKKSQLTHLQALFAQYLPNDDFHIKDFDFFVKLGWTSQNRMFAQSLEADQLLLDLRQEEHEHLLEERETTLQQISKEVNLSVIQAQLESLGIKVAILSDAPAQVPSDPPPEEKAQALKKDLLATPTQDHTVIEIVEKKNEPSSHEPSKHSETKTESLEKEDNSKAAHATDTKKEEEKTKKTPAKKAEPAPEPELMPQTPLVANVLYFGRSVNQLDVKLAALVFIRAGIQLKAIKSFNKKSGPELDHTIALGFNKQFDTAATLPLDTVMKKTFK
jgi:outer membrane biosynthesis protein TonB